jgi:cell fate regulator YaaT (PSP1 superfamily)
MDKAVGIRFDGTGKAIHFNPGSLDLHRGDVVIVETEQGLDLGIVFEEPMELPESSHVESLKPVIRLATDEDLAHYDENKQKEKEAIKIAREKIRTHGLDMHLVDVAYTLDGRKIIFYFTADGRVDFRELVKDLAAIFHTRIELRQIGVRDEARMIGGIGLCGRELCCCSYLHEFVPVSIKMAKVQNLSMNPAKISGVCGRLMCCLKYECAAYEDAQKRMPRRGLVVMTEEGQGNIEHVNLLKETVTVRLDRGGEADLITLPYTKIEILDKRAVQRQPSSNTKDEKGKDAAFSRSSGAQKTPNANDEKKDQDSASKNTKSRRRKKRTGRRRSGSRRRGRSQPKPNSKTNPPKKSS